jgi:hypothetical protein
MPVGFVATESAVLRENGVLVITLGARSNADDDFYLMLQHQSEHSEQDVKFGMHLPYIEYCGQGWSWYGHILAFTLRRSGVRVELDAEAAKRMQNDGQIEIDFSLDQVQFQELRSALQETFAGHAYYQDAA